MSSISEDPFDETFYQELSIMRVDGSEIRITKKDQDLVVFWDQSRQKNLNVGRPEKWTDFWTIHLDSTLGHALMQFRY